MKTIVRLIVTAALIAGLGGAMYYDSLYVAPARFMVRYETLDSIFIPEQMDDVNILFFSDLKYGTFMDQNRLAKLMEAINRLSPDVVIFGGDMFDESALVDDNAAAAVASAFKNIEAPLGKFAVLGDTDHRDENVLAEVKSALYQGDFELLNNRSILLRNKGSDSITLVGLDSALNGEINVTQAFAEVSHTSYTIAICHTPDAADLFPAELTNYALSGHSLGGQVYLGSASLYMPAMAEKYFRGKTTIGGDAFVLDISSGVGTTQKDVRFLANAEIVLYRLKHRTITG
jgi:predicted MPP superfamily phosphohydrolase